MKEMQIPQEYKYVLNRGNFEITRATSNVAFLLSSHCGDKNASFLDSELFQRVEERAEYTYAQRWTFVCGVLLTLLGFMPDVYSITKEDDLLRWEEAEHV